MVRFKPGGGDSEDQKPGEEQRLEATPETANCVTSLAYKDTVTTDDTYTYHRPLLDIDMEAHLVVTTTPGHHHLYIDKLLTHAEYARLIDVLAELGIIQQGIKKQFERDGCTTLRLPGERKY